MNENRKESNKKNDNIYILHYSKKIKQHKHKNKNKNKL